MISIRDERPDDAPAIRTLVIRAYADVPYSNHREHLMVERLRDGDGYIPQLSLVAEAGTVLAGHILLTKARIGRGPLASTTLALAPLSIDPAFQRMGIGKRLVSAAHERALRLGFQSILLIGIPAYYRRFGYEPLSRHPMKLPFEAPEDDCMILALTPGALDGVSGMVEYADGWLDH